MTLRPIDCEQPALVVLAPHDEYENLRPVKTSARKRIDGVVAAVTTLSRLMVLPDRPASPYAVRRVRVVG